ncbi:MAG: peptidoglycan DD-metalloendopeptidase family protein [Candidatus Sungiibacteriota bacterium]
MLLLCRQWRILFFIAVIGAVVFLRVPLLMSARAETLDDLKQAIETKNQEIKKLEDEAAKFRSEIASRQTQAKTLSGELTRIDTAIARLRKEVAVTQQRINGKQLEIKRFAVDISNKQQSIEKIQHGLGIMIRGLFENDREELFAIVLKYGRLSDFLRQIDEAAQLQGRMLGVITTLKDLRVELQVQKTDAEKKQAELKNLQQALTGQRAVQDEQKKSRSDLLVLTKNQEKQYQKMLQESEAKRAALENEIRDIEEKIKITIDSSLLPSRGRGVLAWPLPHLVLGTCRTTLKQDAITNCITQYFGNTAFAAAGAYSGKGHNGMDFRADIGTPVLAADGGIITAVGDTDEGCRRASYGKWILMRHANNLSTLYTHLSAIGVSAGQQVSRGGSIGYSGMTGYATGPHLHFTVFATQGVQVQDIRSRVCGRMMTLPVASLNSYLNPLDYL